MFELKVRFWVDALRWRVESAGSSVCILSRGDPDFGVVLVKVVDAKYKVQLYVPVRNFEGEQGWTTPFREDMCTETEIDNYIDKRMENDPDLWVIEITDGKGRNFLNEPIEKF